MSLIMTTRGWKQLGDGKMCSNHNDLEGVFTPHDIEEVRAEVSARCARFRRALSASAPGSRCGDPTQFRGDHFIEPIYGAFGEKL